MKTLVYVGLVAAALLAPAVAGAEEEPWGRHQLTVGAGVLNYVDGGAPGSSASWDLRYAYTPIWFFSVEGGYEGAAGAAPVRGAATATIIEGDVRFNPIVGYRITGYVLAGAGYGSFNMPDRPDNATVVLPVGAGADYHISDRITAGGRFTYRFVTNDKVGMMDANADHWALIGRVGTTF